MSEFSVVVVGAGMAANFWLPPLLARDDVEIAGIVEINSARGRALAARYELMCGQWQSVTEAVEQTDANLVVDITPPQAHRAIAEEAFAVGCDVVGEKPFAASMADAQAIIAMAEASPCRYAVMQNRRFAPGIRSLRKGIEERMIGNPTFVCADMFVAPHHYGGFRETEMTSPLLLDMAIHTFDQARFLIGADPVSVYCHEFNPDSSWYAGNAAASCLFEFPDGIVFSYRGSWVSEGCPTSFDSVWRVTGTTGSVIWDGEGRPHAEIAVPAAEPQLFLPREVVVFPPTSEPHDPTHHAAAIDHILDSLADRQTPETHCADNITSLAMVFAAMLSARHGCVIALDELISPVTAVAG